MTRVSQTRRANVGLWVVILALVAAAWWLWAREGEEPAAKTEATAAVHGAVGTGLLDRPEQHVDPRLAGAAAISGTIRDLQGQPVAGARVCALAGGPGRTRAEAAPSCSEAGRDGHYQIAGLLAVRHRVHAMAPGFIPMGYTRGEGVRRRETVELRPGQVATGIDITLTGGGVEIHGVVHDLSGGPIEGARVTSGGFGAGTGMALASSGPDGEFSLWVRPGRAMVWSDTEGYAQAYSEGLAPGHRFELYLTPESVVIGKVVRAGDGSPVADAEVWVERGDSSSMTMSGGGGAVFTDAGGNFRVDGLSPGAYKAHAMADDALGVAPEQVVLGLGETSEPIVIKAHPAFYAEGHVVVTGTVVVTRSRCAPSPSPATRTRTWCAGSRRSPRRT